MQIECPNCQTIYDVPDGDLTGRTVRCAQCNQQWQPLPLPPPVSVVAAPPTAVPERPDLAPVEIPQGQPFLAVHAPSAGARIFGQPPPPPPPPGRRATLALAWIASLVLLAGLGGGAVLKRDAVMHAWPPSERLFAKLGLI